MTHPFFWLVMLGRFFSSIAAPSGFLRQHRQQKQKNRVHVPGVAFALVSSDWSESVEFDSFFLQQLEQQHVCRMRAQQGLQHLKQFKRLQQLAFSPSGDAFCSEAFFCVFDKKTFKSQLNGSMARTTFSMQPSPMPVPRAGNSLIEIQIKTLRLHSHET